MFTFPREDNFASPAHVTIPTTNLELRAATVCLRFFTDMTQEYIIFSLAKLRKNFPLIPNMPQPPEKFFQIIANKPTVEDITVSVSGADAVSFHGHNIKLNAWQSLCGTWDADTGLTQIWLNGNPSSRKITSASQRDGAFIVALGKETTLLSVLGVSFKRSFVGMISDLQIWDHALPSDHIQAYNLKSTVPNGNVLSNGNILSWASLEFEVSGPVHLEDE